ncbi:MAG: hypothetical protein MASP_01568 [Candidatus Methanolliviera sp. GoM_asphalt]|nr:MAG: hypothetical protein MASP_01568 [Candidatus Methanolliviera sp. GoM_asphalt]
MNFCNCCDFVIWVFTPQRRHVLGEYMKDLYLIDENDFEVLFSPKGYKQMKQLGKL